MTTLEERRQWMRDGCPMDEPKPKPDADGDVIPAEVLGRALGQDLCEVFSLWVEGGKGGRAREARTARIVTQCRDCRATSVQSEIVRRAPGGLWHGPDLRQAIREVCHHMVEHAVRRGMPALEAEAAYRHVEATSRIADWAVAVMTDGSVKGSDEHGWTAPGHEKRGIVMELRGQEMVEPGP